MGITSKKTPTDVTEFEREQLRFFLAKGDVAALLADLNPSLAWLPMLAELKLIDNQTQLAFWVEKNFAEADAVREVAANIHFFGPGTADILQIRLNQVAGLPTILMKCWSLIIRHMRTIKRGMLHDGWFDVEPRIKRGEQAQELLEQIARVLRPVPRISKRIFWGDDDGARTPEQPTDLISIDFEPTGYVNDDDIVAAWPENTPIESDDRLLRLLTSELTAALEDAIEAGVEGDVGYGLSDSDVPSVAKHSQNAHRTGFLPIVRVVADLWTRVARKDAEHALEFINLWSTSPYRLTRRLALFAAADPVVPADIAARLLMALPAAEIFLTSSTVEVYRLIDARWHDFALEDQHAIEDRMAKGPPAHWFRQDAFEMIDRCCFDLLGYLDRNGVRLNLDAQGVLDKIRERWPKWELKPKERAGFHIWHESSSGIVGNPAELSAVPDKQLIPAAKRAADEADFRGGDDWQALCHADAPHALRGLEAQANDKQWPPWAWGPFLLATSKLLDVNGVKHVAQLLLRWPSDSFPEIAREASWWLREVAPILDENLMWNLWDRVAGVMLQNSKGGA